MSFTVHAIYHNDKKSYTVMIPASFEVSGKHFKVNGEMIVPTDAGRPVTVSGKKIEVKIGEPSTYISHYMNRETKEILPYKDYNENLRSFIDENTSEYKSHLDEYNSNMFVDEWVPVRETVFEYEDCIVKIFNSDYKIDEYVHCAGIYKDKNSGNPGKAWLYEFHMFSYAVDIVRKSMKQLFIEEDITTPKCKSCEHNKYRLDLSKSYKFLELDGQDYFILYKDLFFNYSCDVIYMSKEDVIENEKRIKNIIVHKINDYLKKARTVEIKRYYFDDWSKRITDMVKESKDGKIDNQEVIRRITDIRYELNGFSTPYYLGGQAWLE